MFNKIAAIIPAAGRGQRMLSMTDKSPKSMFPVANKPLISYHLDDLYSNGITDVYIIVGYKKEVLINYVNMMYSDKLNITFVVQTELLGLAHAINLAMNEIINKDYTGVYIALGDNLIRNNNVYTLAKESKNSFILYKPVSDYSRWCLVNVDKYNNIINFMDKPEYEPKDKNAVIGIYYFNEIKDFKKALDDVIGLNIKIKGEYQLSSVMEYYINKYEHPIKAIESKENEWFDFGELETYNESKKLFNSSRCFNNIVYNSDNTITKKSSNYNKLQKEIIWFLSLPKSLQKYIPKLIEYSLVDDNVYYTLEYVNGTPLQELFIYNYLNNEDWSKIFELINKLIKDMKNVSKPHSNDLFKFLYNNYHNRLLRIHDESSKLLQELIDNECDFITINNISYLTFNMLKEYINDKLNYFKDDTKYSQIIHGDLVFSNMIYDIGSNNLKLIDPRGDFNGDIIYGDIRYDIAKIAQCVFGKYDYIVNDLTKIPNISYNNEDGTYSIKYDIYNIDDSTFIDNIFTEFLEKNNFNKSEILFITAMQFLTMIPLHSENEHHQIMMFIKFIELMNAAKKLDEIK